MLKKIYFLLILLFSIICLYLGFNSTIIPNIVLYILIVFYIINLLILYLLLVKKRNKNKKRKIFIILGIILSIILITLNTAIVFINIKANKFLNTITNVKFETTSYSLIVLKDSNYKYVKDLSIIGLYYNEIDTNYEEALKKLTEKINITEKTYTNPLLLITDLMNKTTDGIFLNSAYIDIFDEASENFSDNIKIIDTIDINKAIETNDEKIDITKLKSFNLYISGIDTDGPITRVSRSDVNIIATINLETGKILLTNTPRDYYVQLHGTTGLKDKITHAGALGIEMSRTTLEDLYEIEIPYYVRVNFDSLIKVVDAIGGIDVYSDRSFKWNKNIYINVGWNHMDGKKALAYARTRKIYEGGDRHRGQNQQQVIEAIFKKVTKSNNLSYYISLFNAIEGSFQTNIDKENISNLINYQVKNNPNWKFETISVDGYGTYTYFYSMPNFYNYAMIPYPETVEAAKKKINEILNETKE